MDLSAFPTDSDPKTMRDAIKDGSITEATITEAARRVLYEIVRFGYLDGKQKHEVTAQDLDGNGAIIEKTAEDAAVLLKNEGNILPLKATDSIAMIGPTAGQVASIGTFGERSPGSSRAPGKPARCAEERSRPMRRWSSPSTTT